VKPSGLLKRNQLSMKLQLPAGKSIPQQSQKLAAEHSAQHLYWQEELPAAVDPARTAGR